MKRPPLTIVPPKRPLPTMAQFLSPEERRDWHLNVIADRDAYFVRNPNVPRFQNLKASDRP